VSKPIVLGPIATAKTHAFVESDVRLKRHFCGLCIDLTVLGTRGY